jgi:LysM repeat protein
MLNIQQHFFKYRKRFNDEKTLKSESLLDVIFQEDLKQDTTQVQDIDSTTTQIKINNESKVIDQKVIPKKKPTTRYYKVKSGDTLSEIAEKYNTSVAKIKKINNLKSDNLRIGQSLKIPS